MAMSTVLDVFPQLPIDSTPVGEAAELYVALGLPPLPVYGLTSDNVCSCIAGVGCRSPGKHPVGNDWQSIASLDVHEIRARFREHDGNIGLYLGSTRHVLIDADGDIGLATLDTWDLPPTLRAQSGSGRGAHLVYELAEGQDSKAITDRRVAPGVDVKVRGQFVVAPSHHASGGRYRWTDLLPIAFLSDELYARIRKPVIPTIAPPAPSNDPPHALLKRAEAYLGRIPPAIAGAGGHDQTFAASRALAAFVLKGLPESQAYALLVDYNGRCKPPWSERELRHKWNEAKKAEHLPAIEDRPREAMSATRLRVVSGTPPGTPPPDAPTVIRLGVDLKRVTNEACAALARSTGTFHRSGSLVRIVSERGAIEGVTRASNASSIRVYAQPTLLEVLSEVARWERYDARAKDWSPTAPPVNIAAAVAERGEWTSVPPLVGVVETPALRPAGTVIQDPGYDAATGFFYAPSGTFPLIPDQPTREDALRAVDALLEVVRDFPFATPDHRSAWLAFLLTLFARPAVNGCVPLIAIDATVPGTGKGKLADATVLLATGRDATKTPLPDDENEFRKRITALIIEGELVACIDNIHAPINSAALDAAITATTWKDRVLGKSATVCAPNLMVWVATGNNLQFGADTARRTLHIRLESRMENPENRDDFAHADLLGWIRQERPRLVAAALTILRAYYAAGAPDVGVKPWGSFESWSRVIASCVVWAGQPNPQNTRTALTTSADATKSALACLVEGWAILNARVHGPVTARTAIALLYPSKGDGPPDGLDDLREAIETLAPPAPGRPPSSQKVGYALRRYRRRVIAGRMLDCVMDRNGTAKWAVLSAAPIQGAGDAGDAGDVPNPSWGKCQGGSGGSVTVGTPGAGDIPRMPCIPRSDQEEIDFSDYLRREGVTDD